MNYNDYLAKVEMRFSGKQVPDINAPQVTQFYEEKFKATWLATKLKMYSFVAYQSHISKESIATYSDSCTKYALNAYQGLPRGFQNGVGSINVLASESIDAEAIEYAMARPKKLFAAFEMPVIYDLANDRVFYFTKTPMWGAIYYKYIREYIEQNFK